MSSAPASTEVRAPERAGVVLALRILVAAVANPSLSVADVARPPIGEAFDAVAPGAAGT